MIYCELISHWNLVGWKIGYWECSVTLYGYDSIDSCLISCWKFRREFHEDGGFIGIISSPALPHLEFGALIRSPCFSKYNTLPEKV